MALNNLQWLICHKTKLNQIIYRPHIEMNTIWEPIIEKAKSNCFLK